MKFSIYLLAWCVVCDLHSFFLYWFVEFDTVTAGKHRPCAVQADVYNVVAMLPSVYLLNSNLLLEIITFQAQKNSIAPCGLLSYILYLNLLYYLLSWPHIFFPHTNTAKKRIP